MTLSENLTTQPCFTNMIVIFGDVGLGRPGPGLTWTWPL